MERIIGTDLYACKKDLKCKTRSLVTTRKLAVYNSRIGELELKVRLLTNDFTVALDMRKQLTARDDKVAVMEKSSTILDSSLASTKRSHGVFQIR